MIEHINEAINELKNRIKDAGIKGFDIQYYMGNGDYEEIVFMFPNDLDDNGNPCINKMYDEKEAGIRINSTKPNSKEEALKYIGEKCRVNDEIFDDIFDWDDTDPLGSSEYDAYFNKIIDILKAA